MKYYLAYGSNLNKEQMFYRCPTAIAVGTTTIKNYRLLFRGSGSGNYLTIEPALGFSVPVAIWHVDDACERALDRYEGFPRFYYKRNFVLTSKRSKKSMVAFAYIMNENFPLGEPHQYYVDTCLKGYEEFGFDPSTLYTAIEFSKGGDYSWQE